MSAKQNKIKNISENKHYFMKIYTKTQLFTKKASRSFPHDRAAIKATIVGGLDLPISSQIRDIAYSIAVLNFSYSLRLNKAGK